MELVESNFIIGNILPQFGVIKAIQIKVRNGVPKDPKNVNCDELKRLFFLYFKKYKKRVNQIKF